MKVNTKLETLNLKCAQQQGNTKQGREFKRTRQTDNQISEDRASALGEALKVNAALINLDQESVKQQTDSTKQGHNLSGKEQNRQ